MTEEQRKLCRDLIMFPDGQRRVTNAEFLRQFPSAVEHDRLALKWLQEAYETRNADDLSYAFVIGGTFGYVPEHKDILRRLIDEDWHYCHEGVVSALEAWPTSDTVDALFRATQWIPKALEYDDARALAVKAIWALGKIPGPEAEAKLRILAHSENVILRKNRALCQYCRRIDGLPQAVSDLEMSHLVIHDPVNSWIVTPQGTLKLPRP